MGSPLGKSVMPTLGTPVVGANTQSNFFNALFGTGLSQNPSGGWGFAGMPTYQGQLTPDLNGSVAQQAWNAWTPQAPGMSPMQSQLNTVMQRQQQMDPMVQSILQGGAGTSAPQMNNLIYYGSAGPGGEMQKNMAMGNTQGNPLSFLSQYMNGGGGGGMSVANPFSMMMGGPAARGGGARATR